MTSAARREAVDIVVQSFNRYLLPLDGMWLARSM